MDTHPPMDHPDYEGKDLNEIPIEEYKKLWSPPAVWIPHGELANSPGEPIFDYSGGNLVHSRDRCSLETRAAPNIMRVSLDKVGGEYQGVIFDFINRCKQVVSAMSLTRMGHYGSAKPVGVGAQPEERNMAYRKSCGTEVPCPFLYMMLSLSQMVSALPLPNQLTVR